MVDAASGYQRLMVAPRDATGDRPKEHGDGDERPRHDRHGHAAGGLNREVAIGA
jgi:hypothetical protein